MDPVTVLFFGSQGAGKGTQVTTLLDYLKQHTDRGVIHIDMGQELRNIAATGSPAGEKIQEVLHAGARIFDFVPIYAQTKIIFENLLTGREHIVADGLARGPEQTRAYDDMMVFFGRQDYRIVDLVINEETAIKRLLARGRDDDTEEAIRRRLAWTKTDVMPQLDFLRSRGRTIQEIDGEPDVETVHRAILAALKLQ